MTNEGCGGLGEQKQSSLLHGDAKEHYKNIPFLELSFSPSKNNFVPAFKPSILSSQNKKEGVQSLLDDKAKINYNNT